MCKAWTSFGRRASTASHTVSTHTLYPTLADGSLASQQLVISQSNQTVFYNANTASENALKAPGFIDFRVCGAQPITRATLAMTMLNDTGVEMQLYGPYNPVFYMQRVEILAENGAVEVNRLEAEHIIQGYAYLDTGSENIVRRGLEAENYNEPWDTAGTSAWNANDTRTVYIPLPRTIFDHHIFGAGLRSAIVVRVYFRGSAGFGTNAAPSGPPSLQKFQLITEQSGLDHAEYQALQARYLTSKIPLSIRYSRPSFQRVTETLTANGRAVVQLTSVTGLVQSLCVMVQSASADPWFWRTPTFIKSLDVLDGSGASILGGTPLATEYIQTQIHAREYGSFDAMDTGSKCLLIPFSDHAGVHEQNGTIGGYRVFDGTYQLALETTAAAVGSFTIMVLYQTASRMVVEKGNVRVEHS